jgi:response regulator RpfG family c-di-GMP phosphodiesterase
LTVVLVVEAQAAVRRALREWIEAEGSTALEAESAERALELVAATSAPAAAFCDISLPGKDGIWLAERLRSLHPQTAVILTTAVHDLELGVKGLRAGAVDYLVKPCARERVAEALHRALLTHKARRTLAGMERDVEQWRAQVTEAIAQVEASTARSLEALLATRQSGDTGSGERTNRVARVAVNLALTLHVGEPQLTDIERSVMLRDSTHAPTPDELHTLAILNRVPLLARATGIALTVHERYDGGGIEHRLRGEEIPLGGRIVAVAAAYDSLVSGADGVAPAAAVDIVARERALRFDPRVVDALRTLYTAAAPAAVLEAEATRGDGLPPGLIWGTAKNDPRRNWTRKNLAQALAASLGGQTASVIDVGYGGLRLEVPTGFDVASAVPLVLEIPALGLQATAECVWVKARGTLGRSWCGAAVSSEEVREGSRWRAFVDALPPTAASPIGR